MTIQAKASVLTAKGIGAISCIQLTGSDGRKIIEKIFTPAAGSQPQLSPGSFVTGNIHDSGRVIDHILLGCESENNFAINCHGNPIIVEMIMNLLQASGAKPAIAEDILYVKFAGDCDNTIGAEAKLAQLKAVTFEGVKIIAIQPGCGLGRCAKEWLDNQWLHRSHHRPSQQRQEYSAELPQRQAEGHSCRYCRNYKGLGQCKVQNRAGIG
jgi:hypothetical protein